LGLAVSCAGASVDFATDTFAALVGALPEITIVLEHLGALSRPDRDDTERALRQQVLALARFPNCCIKITGLGEFAQRALPVTELFPFVEPIPSLLTQAYDAFGSARMMWGSDYPPVSAREGYGSALRLPMEQLAHISEDDRALIFGGAARRIFPPR
jgi:L-fuconolactonase